MLKKQLIQRIARWLFMLFFLFLTVMLLVSDPWSLLGFPRSPGGNGGTMHFTAFVLLGILLEAGNIPLSSRVLYPTIYFYATSIEMFQSLNPHRTFDWFDMLMNAVGLTIGIVLMKTIAWYRSRRNTTLEDTDSDSVPAGSISGEMISQPGEAE